MHVVNFLSVVRSKKIVNKVCDFCCEHFEYFLFVLPICFYHWGLCQQISSSISSLVAYHRKPSNGLIYMPYGLWYRNILCSINWDVVVVITETNLITFQQLLKVDFRNSDLSNDSIFYVTKNWIWFPYINYSHRLVILSIV